MSERTYSVLAPSYHGATLLAKLLNAHPETTTLTDTCPSNSFDQTCGYGEPVSRCTIWQAVKAETGAQSHAAHARLKLPLYPGETGGMAGRLAYSDFLSFLATPGTLGRWYGWATVVEFGPNHRAFLDAVHRHAPRPGRILWTGLNISRGTRPCWRRAP